MSHCFKGKYLILMLALLVASGVAFSGEVIQTQESDTWEGISADLKSMEVKDNIITVKFILRNSGTKKHSVKINYNACYLMDAANQKKYFPLKDSDGLFIAGPMYDQGDGGRFWFDMNAGESKGMWIKFPQPTDNPETISIAVPGIFPFEDITLTK